MKLKFVLLLTVLAVALTPLSAAPVTFYANLNGPAEFPPVNSLGTGLTLVTVDDMLHTMRVEASFSGLTGLTTVAHIHLGRPTGGVITTVPSFPGFPTGVTSGTYDQTFDLTLASSYNPSFLNNAVNMGDVAIAEASLLAGIASGDAYLNIHSSFSPSGEIRGFLTPVPEPATFALAGGALAGLALWRRKRASRVVSFGVE